MHITVALSQYLAWLRRDKSPQKGREAQAFDYLLDDNNVKKRIDV